MSRWDSASRMKKEGRNAFSSGCDMDDYNPHKFGTERFSNWAKGWLQAENEYYEELERLRDCPFQAIKEQIAELQADPTLIDILENIVELMEGNKR